MPVLFDAKFLFFLFDPSFAGTENQQRAFNCLLEKLSDTGTQIVVPTPALAELFVGSPDEAPNILETLQKSKNYKIEIFGVRAAVELGTWEAHLRSIGNKRNGSEDPYQKIKFDRQICAIAKVSECDTVYSEDRGLRHHCHTLGIEALGIDDLSTAAEDAQPPLI